MLAVDESLPVGLYLMDCDGVFLYGNERLQKILEWPTPLLGVSLAEFFPPERRYSILKNHQKYFGTPGILVHQTVYLTTAKGRQITADIQATTYTLEDNFNVVVGTLNDITEDEHLRLKKDATERVVLHDLKNPLSGFLGLAQLLKREFRDNSEVTMFSDELQLRGMRLLRLLETQLALGRIESEQFRLIREPIDIPGMLDEALEDWVPEDLRAGKHFQTVFDDHLSESDFNSHTTLLRVVIGQILRFGFEQCPTGGKIEARFSFTSTGDLVFKMSFPLPNVEFSHLDRVLWDDLLQMSLWLVSKAITQLGIQLDPLTLHDSFVLTVHVPTGFLEDSAW